MELDANTRNSSPWGGSCGATSSPLGVAPSGPRGRSPQVAEGDSEARVGRSPTGCAVGHVAEGDPVLFLDIDGCLNRKIAHANGYCGLRPKNVRNLNHILASPRVRIVISSAWRYMISSGS